MSIKLTRTNAQYPSVLHELADPPAQIFAKGNKNLLNGSPVLAVIGARNMTPYGRSAIEKLIPPLAKSGVIILSGLAIGCDGLAHEVALAEGGKCIGVLPVSLDKMYPRRHTPLSEALLKANGLLISEYPDGTEGPYAHHFLARNRIIAALADVLLIVEAAARSGTLSTARHALDLGKDVAAIPGRIMDESSIGTNRLLQRGAHLITTAQDLADLLAITLQQQLPVPQNPHTEDEKKVLQALTEKSCTVDQLVSMGTMDTSAVLAALSGLEMSGHIYTTDGFYSIS
ncbi:MAG: DNA-processing protein DprA [Patescibacteria group bacterium]|jgi:DNA processing protein